VLFGTSVVMGVITVGAAFRNGVRQELFIAAAAYSLIAFMAGAFLLVTAPQAVSTPKVAAWSIPGLAILLMWSMVIVENWAERVFIPYPLLGQVGMLCGPVSPLTSVAATVLVVRLPSALRAALCLGSWAGTIMFWGNVLGVLPGPLGRM